jgi:hypothetical protein
MAKGEKFARVVGGFALLVAAEWAIWVISGDKQTNPATARSEWSGGHRDAWVGNRILKPVITV